MRLHPPPNQQPWSAFTVSQKVQLTYKLFLLENARNVLNKELDNLANKAYEDVRGLLNSSFSIGAFKSVSETVEAKCWVIEKLSELLRSASQDFDEHNNIMDHNQPVKKRDTFKFGPMLQNTIMSSISRAVQVLGALVVPQKCTKRDNKINMNQATVSEVQEKDTVCSATCSTVQDTAVKKETEGKNLEKSTCHKPILLPATCDIVKTNSQELLLPPIPAIPPATEYEEPPVGVPMMKWGHDDIQVQHKKQTASQLLYFLSAVKAEYTGELEVPVMERSLSPQTCSVQNITEQAYQFKEDAEWSPGMLSETANHMPLFKLKRVDSGLGSLTYTCVIVTKTELWDMGDIVTEFECESSSVSSEETCVAELSDETLQWVNAAMHKDETTSARVPTHNAITIPEFQNKRFEEIEVVVSHIVTPGNFYIQHADAKEKLQALIADTFEKSVSFAEQHCIPDIGTKVMGWFPQQKQWCRSKVTKICGISKDDDDNNNNNNNNNNTNEMSITVEVMRLDYGDSLCLPLSNLKEMTSEMVILPLQGVQVSLAHVSPVNGRGWSEEAVDWFRDMVHKRTLYARLYPEGPRVAAELFLEKGNIQAMRRGASLSLRLTQNGHARHDKLKDGVGNMKLKMKKKDLQWEKYLISFYTQSHLHKAVL